MSEPTAKWSRDAAEAECLRVIDEARTEGKATDPMFD
jgi:hypothetical protein